MKLIERPRIQRMDKMREDKMVRYKTLQSTRGEAG
jgi:hypothetical protein